MIYQSDETQVLSPVVLTTEDVASTAVIPRVQEVVENVVTSTQRISYLPMKPLPAVAAVDDYEQPAVDDPKGWRRARHILYLFLILIGGVLVVGSVLLIIFIKTVLEPSTV